MAPEAAAVPSGWRSVAVGSGAVSRSQLRGPRWRRLSRGLYVPAVDAANDLADLGDLAQVLPSGSGFGHLTAVSARGWWLPNRLPRHVVFASTRSGVHVQRSGMYVRRSRLLELEHVRGLPMASAPTLLVELARDLTLVDLVPMVDCALAGGATVEQLRAACRRRTRGVVTLRRAIELGDPRSESWWESVLRVMHVVTGLGPVESQVDIVDGDGVFVGRADLHLVGTNRYPECDGGDHRTKDRHAQDLTREKGISRLGLERFGYTTDEICRRPELVIRDAEDARLLPHDRERARTWWRHARASTLTAYGRTRLAARLERYRQAGAPLLATSDESACRPVVATRQESP
jgi:hypothetical protein